MDIIKKYKDLSKGLKASFWFAFCSVLQKGIAFVVTPIYTRILTKEEFGLFSTYNSWLSIIAIFATLYLSAGVMNNILNKKEDFNSTDSQVLSNLQFLEIILVTVVSGCILIFNFYLPNVLHIPQTALLLICVTIFFQSAVSLWTTKEKFNYNYIPVVAVTLIVSILTPVFNILLLKYYAATNISLLLGTAISCGLIYTALMAFNLFKGRQFFNLKLWKFAILFNLPLIPHYLSLIILGTSDKIMIERLQGSEYAALYSIPYSIASLVSILSSAINSSLVPFTYKKLKSGNYSGIDRYTNLVLVLFTVVSFFIMMFGPEVIYIMGGKDYMEAKYVIPPVAASTFFMFLYPIFGNVEFYYEKRFLTMYSSVIAALINIGLNFIFIPIYGYIAAAFTTILCYILLAVFHYVAYKIILRKNNISYFYNNKVIIVLSLINIGMIAIAYLLYLNNVVRYICLGISFLITIVFSKKIIKIFLNLIKPEKNNENDL